MLAEPAEIEFDMRAMADFAKQINQLQSDFPVFVSGQNVASGVQTNLLDSPENKVVLHDALDRKQRYFVRCGAHTAIV